MKKILICMSAIGIASVVAYLCFKEKEDKPELIGEGTHTFYFKLDE